MHEKALQQLGLSATDFDGEPPSAGDLVTSIASSGRLYRKTLQHLVLTDLRRYFAHPGLQYADDIRPFFPYAGRRKKWSHFRDSLSFTVPGLRVGRLATGLMVVYLLGYGYTMLSLLFNHADFLVHANLSGLSFSGLLLSGALLPVAGLYLVGKTALPATHVDGLVDLIIRENMRDLLADHGESLKERIRDELKETT